MRVGLLGAGRIGKFHAHTIAMHPKAQLVAVADTNAEAAQALAQRTGAKVAAAQDIIADPQVDILFICTSTDTHADFLEQAAPHKKVIFCEKPIDLSTERVRACLQNIKSTGVRLMIGFHRRFDPHFGALAQRLRAGEVGQPEMIHIVSRDRSPPPNDYILRSGGIYRDMIIHDFDMARFLAAEPIVEVFAAGSCLGDKYEGRVIDYDTSLCVLKTQSGGLINISNSRRATVGHDQRIEVLGSKGILSAGNPTPSTVMLANAQGYTSEPCLPSFLERYEQAYRLELNYFFDAVERGDPLSPTGEDGLKAQVIADAAALSAQTGVPVRVEA